MFWIGVDIGGTFTDLCLINSETAEVRTHKTPTTPTDPAIGFLTGVDEMLEEHGVPMSSVSHMVHGTTLASNVILEAEGRGIALLTTQGFRDVLIIQRQKRFDIYDLDIEKPTPLLKRRRCAHAHRK